MYRTHCKYLTEKVIGENMNNLTDLKNIAKLALGLQKACIRAKVNQGELLRTSNVSVFHREVDKVRKELTFLYCLPDLKNETFFRTK